MENEAKIWSFLQNCSGLNDYAIAGIMANIQAESGGEPIRRQGDFSSDRSISKAYAAKVDSGDTTTYLSGIYGWGLCQWTYPARCENLLNFCKRKGTSIGDLNSQLQFMLEEMQGEAEFKGCWNKLCTANNLLSPVTAVCEGYEKPANATAQTKVRYAYAEEIYERNHKEEAETVSNTEIKAAITEILNMALDQQSKAKEMVEKCQTLLSSL